MTNTVIGVSEYIKDFPLATLFQMHSINSGDEHRNWEYHYLQYTMDKNAFSDEEQFLNISAACSFAAVISVICWEHHIVLR